MEVSSMQVKTRYTEHATVLELSGRFDKYTAPPITQWFDKNIGAETAHIIVNLAGVNFIDSTALALLVQAMRRCNQRDVTLALCGLQQPVFMIFELTRLDKAFSIFIDEQHALRSLAG
jgi:anti-sigma B factor antagonist